MKKLILFSLAFVIVLTAFVPMRENSSAEAASQPCVWREWVVVVTHYFPGGEVVRSFVRSKWFRILVCEPEPVTAPPDEEKPKDKRNGKDDKNKDKGKDKK
jgi:hypothetical protein